MKGVFLTVALLGLPLAIQAQERPEPVATYDVEARVVEAVDDVAEAVSYLRVRLVVLSVGDKTGPEGTPSLGSGTTIMAIVRDDAHRAILRSASPTQAIEMSVGWFDQGTYEVRSVLGQTAAALTTVSEEDSADRNFALLQLLGLLIGLAALGFVALRLLHRTDHAG